VKGVDEGLVSQECSGYFGGVAALLEARMARLAKEHVHKPHETSHRGRTTTRLGVACPERRRVGSVSFGFSYFSFNLAKYNKI
jgi:hypothetical protein